MPPSANRLERQKHKPAILCDWHKDVPEADLVIINRGMWRSSDHLLLSELNRTLTFLNETYQGTDRPAAQRVIFRSTWGSLHACQNLSDPLTMADAQDAMRQQVIKQRDHYEWGKIAHQNELAKRVVHSFGFVFWDVYSATLTRPGGRLTPREKDCGHFCLPGPPDDLTRQLLEFITTAT